MNVVEVVVIEERMRRWRKELALLGATCESAEREREKERQGERERQKEKGDENRLVPRDGSWLLVADARRVALFIRTRRGGSGGKPRVGYPA